PDTPAVRTPPRRPSLRPGLPLPRPCPSSSSHPGPRLPPRRVRNERFACRPETRRAAVLRRRASTAKTGQAQFAPSSFHRSPLPSRHPTTGVHLCVVRPDDRPRRSSGKTPMESTFSNIYESLSAWLRSPGRWPSLVLVRLGHLAVVERL